MAGKESKRLHRGVVQIELDLLKRDIMEYGKSRGKYTDWVTYLGISVSCLVNLLVSDFKDTPVMTADQWQIIIILITLISGGAAIVRFAQNVANTEKKCISCTMTQVKRDACNPHEDRILFIIIKCVEREKPQLLVYRDLIWNCWFLPNISQGDLDMQSMRAYIAQDIGMSVSDVQLELFPDKDDCCTRKLSQSYLEVTDYYYKFCFVKITAASYYLEKLWQPQFEHSGRSFQWMSITEMLTDPHIREKNSDIVHYLQDHYETFFYNRRSIEEV